MKFSDADYMGIAVGATYSLCNPHLNRKFMNLVWLIGCLSLFLYTNNHYSLGSICYPEAIVTSFSYQPDNLFV